MNQRRRNVVGGWRLAAARWVRSQSGPRAARLAGPLHSFSLHALGLTTADMPLLESGERHVVELLRGHAAPTVLDVGAFEGDYGVMVRSVLGSTATIHCFEPGAAGLARLRKRAESAQLVVHALAVARETGSVVLHSEPGLPITASLQPETLAVGGRVATLEETVGATSIDDFCEQQGIGAVDLLKIDVEGLELDVLRGASRLLARDAVSLIQFEFGYGTVAARAYMRDFYELLAPTHTLHRVAPRGLIALGEYRLAHEIFVGMTNYVAVPRRMGERR